MSYRMNALAYASDLARDLDLALGRNPGRHLIHHLDLARDRARDLVLALDLNSGRDLARARDRDFVHGLALDLALALALACNRALDRARVLDRARGLDPPDAFALALAHAHADSLARDLDHARDLARELASVLGRQFGLQNVEGLASALLAGALDDFSHTDLSGIDLTYVDLVGVRWSVQDTRWPPATDIERLRSASEETEPGSGVFVVTRPRGTDRTGEEERI